MAKIPFDIKYRPQIESGEYKVVNRKGEPVRVVCYDMKFSAPLYARNQRPILSLQKRAFTGDEFICYHFHDGMVCHGEANVRDLFIVTPEEEMSEFENHLLDWLSSDTSGEIPMERMKEVVRNRAAELLAIARKELEPEVLKRLEETYKNQDDVVYEIGKCDGRAEALKDLPRWKKTANRGTYVNGAYQLLHDGYYLEIEDIEKLPGFKEDK